MGSNRISLQTSLKLASRDGWEGRAGMAVRVQARGGRVRDHCEVGLCLCLSASLLRSALEEGEEESFR